MFDRYANAFTSRVESLPHATDLILALWSNGNRVAGVLIEELKPTYV